MTRGVRIPALDGIRGVAILLVLAHHFTIYGFERSAAGIPTVLYRVLEAGWIGVDLFFVLSGFLITGILYRDKGTANYFSSFYARRTLRIFPLYFGFLAVAVVLLPWLLPDNIRLQGWQLQSPAYWTYTTNVVVAWRGWNVPEAQGLEHFWSLALEEQFYLLWPLATYFFDRRALTRLCVVCVIGSILFRAALVTAGRDLAAYTLMPARMDALAAGAFVALQFADARPSERARRLAWLIGATMAASLCAIGVLEGRLDAGSVVMQTVGYTFVATMFAATLVIVMSSPEAGGSRLLKGRVLTDMGRYSYGLYVVHHPILFLLPPALLASTFASVVGNVFLARLAAIAVLAVLCQALAMASWHYFEKPIMNLGPSRR